MVFPISICCLALILSNGSQVLNTSNTSAHQSQPSQSSPSQVAPTALVAIIGLLAGNLILTLGDVAIKSLGASVGLFQYLAIRYLLTLMLIWPIWRRLSAEQRAPSGFKIHLLRGHLSLLGAVCAFYSLLHLSLATANVIFYAAPLVTLLLARIWLKQVFTYVQVTQVCLGFIGVMIALRPDELHWTVLTAITVAFTVALFNLLSYKMPKNQAMPSMVLWGNLSALPLSVVLATIFWQPLQIEMLILAAIVAITTTLYQVIAAKAYRSSSAGEIVIAEYSGLLFALLIGIFSFDEPAHWYTLTGIALIILPMAWQSAHLYRKRASTMQTSSPS